MHKALLPLKPEVKHLLRLEAALAVACCAVGCPLSEAAIQLAWALSSEDSQESWEQGRGFTLGVVAR